MPKRARAVSHHPRAGQPAQLLEALIALPSVNPAFLPPGDPRTGELRVAEFLAALGARAGLDAALEEVVPGRPNVFLRLSAKTKARQRILLAPHLDTVGAPGSLEALFQPRRQNDRIYGRGACDTKGSVAAMVSALMAVAESGARPAQTEIVFAGFIDEEFHQRGVWHFVKQRQRVDLAIVGEPTQLQIVTAHKGDVWLEIKTTGKSAHGARPELGQNAVHKMARVVDVLESDYPRLLRKRRHPLLGSPTINVGTIRGGQQPNIVPSECTISVDRRTLPGETETSVRREVAQFLRRHGHQVHLTSLKAADCIALETDPRLPLVQRFLEAAGQEAPVGVDFFCDASVLGQAGIASVVFGPGNIDQAHTTDEWISLRSLDRSVALLTRFLRALP